MTHTHPQWAVLVLLLLEGEVQGSKQQQPNSRSQQQHPQSLCKPQQHQPFLLLQQLRQPSQLVCRKQ